MESTYKVSIALPSEDASDIMVAMLTHAGFESFEETPQMLHAYCTESQWNPETMIPLSEQLLHLSPGSLSAEKIEPRNYNAEWESRLEPVYIDDFVQILPKPDLFKAEFVYTLHIRPRMSFGTGHHQTTRSVIRLMRIVDFSEKRVWDVGSGTGVLGILAARMGASSVIGTDIEEWCTENAIENALNNQIEALSEWHTGSTETLNILKPVDIILANLNLNLLRDQASYFHKYLVTGGKIIVSGFYTTDKDAILQIFEPLGFTEIKTLTEENWIAVLMQSYV